MSAFQLDECLNSRKLWQRCAKDAQVEVRRFPSEMRGESDPEVIARIATISTLVTSDRTLADQHFATIPFRNRGIIMLEPPEPRRTATLEDYERVLSEFKAEFEGWQNSAYDGSILTIAHEYVEVQHVDSERRLVCDEFIHRTQIGWQVKLREALGANSSRVSRT